MLLSSNDRFGFILGYTGEVNGIYDRLPVIIFDDFTTDSHLVDFPFKVKSSAMKILHVSESIDIQYVAYFMSITRLIGDTHKRYWISEYSNLCIPLPPIAEQKRIVAEIERWFALIDDLEANKQDLQTAVKRTKTKVLDLAIHGKLVPQDPADEPAIDLLHRINPHFSPSDTSHYQNTPFDIPQSWQWVRLGEVVNVMNGKNQKAVVDENGQYPIYGSGGIIGYANEYLCKEHSTIIGRKGTIDNPILVETKFWNVDTAFGMEPNKNINHLFFYYFCKGYNFKELDKSTTLPSLTKVSIERILIPLPPLAEQKRIVAKIESIFAQLDNITENIQ